MCVACFWIVFSFCVCDDCIFSQHSDFLLSKLPQIKENLASITTTNYSCKWIIVFLREIRCKFVNSNLLRQDNSGKKLYVLQMFMISGIGIKFSHCKTLDSLNNYNCFPLNFSSHILRVSGFNHFDGRILKTN